MMDLSNWNIYKSVHKIKMEKFFYLMGLGLILYLLFLICFLLFIKHFLKFYALGYAHLKNQ